ncbi:uncharacterized protein SCHCODRAFT_02507070 [Schizophyllum commune H4-8]|uniref:uncharacterized protein n=1 Tax=Schizophyllum commune (strain H4-8 / FGSC 9210) TaxID=578458 RepID=UPI00215FF7ED|nr:uncharacterized protein SCHCODRAFT_02507070 [Schizophyllum commune H4-8]KAI5890230.1 hypothetical protein SCHCODRAFT_02507070 [Schizophyllum commune H4-8]
MSRCMSARWLGSRAKRMKARAFTAVLPLRPRAARAGAFHCPLIVSHRLTTFSVLAIGHGIGMRGPALMQRQGPETQYVYIREGYRSDCTVYE